MDGENYAFALIFQFTPPRKEWPLVILDHM